MYLSSVTSVGQMKWAPLPEELQHHNKRMSTILQSWENTPYLDLFQSKGIGTDCVRYTCACYDEFLGIKTEIKTLPPDAALHNKKEAMRAMMLIKRLYAHKDVEGEFLQPYDMIVVGSRRGGPGHAQIVGTQRNTIWECQPTGVKRTGFFTPKGMKVFAMYRLEIL